MEGCKMSELRRITPEEVDRAVQKNGFPLHQGLYWVVSTDPVTHEPTDIACACALGHVYLQDMSAKEVYEMSNIDVSVGVKLGLDFMYQYGFMSGFDSPSWVNHGFSGNTLIGFEDGKRVAEHFGLSSNTNPFPG